MRREDESDNVRVVVGMATCGIAAGARPVMLKFMEEINKREHEQRNRLPDRLHRHVPPGAHGGRIYARQGKGNLRAHDPRKGGPRIVAEHIVNGRPVTEYTIGAAEGIIIPLS